jgi:polyglutamine-binding protein 1
MQRWGPKAFQHDPTLDMKHERLLRRYPVPLGFVEVGDPDTGRYYYWNTETDEVSWLPPQHPRAKICLPAERLLELVQKSERTLVRMSHDSEGESEDDSTDLDDEDDLDEDQDFEQLEKEVLKRKKQSEEDRGISKKRRDAKLDPMDPAAYSDIPKGNWSSGLEKSGSAKTGVDVTASGPLFQQRPYPSPGAVLRMNDKK